MKLYKLLSLFSIILFCSCESTIETFRAENPEFKGKHLLFNQIQLNSKTDNKIPKGLVDKVEWLKRNRNSQGYLILRALNLVEDYDNNKLLYYVDNDTTLFNFIFLKSSLLNKKLDSGEIKYRNRKSDSNNLKAFRKIKDPHIRAMVLTISDLKMDGQYGWLLDGIDDKDDLLTIAENGSQYISYNAGNHLRKSWHLGSILKYLWSIKISIIMLIIFALINFALPQFILFTLPQICYVLLVWRFDENAWPGFLGYFITPFIGLLIGVYYLYILGVGYDKLLNLINNKRLSSIANRVASLGLIAISIATLIFLENSFFSDGLDIVGQGIGSGPVMLSDKVLQDESFWGYILYTVNGVQIVLFLGSLYFFASLFYQDLLTDAIENLKDFKNDVISGKGE